MFVSRPCGLAHAIANAARLYPKCFSIVIKMGCWLFGEKSCVGKCPHMTKKQLSALPKCQMKSAKHFYCQQESSGGPRGASDHENPDFSAFWGPSENGKVPPHSKVPVRSDFGLSPSCPIILGKLSHICLFLVHADGREQLPMHRS